MAADRAGNASLAVLVHTTALRQIRRWLADQRAVAGRRKVTVTLAAALSGAALSTMGASADGAPPITRHARPGGLVSFSVPVADARTCGVRAGGRRRTADVTGAVGIKVSFRVAPLARAGTWQLSVACAPGAAQRVVLTVAGTRHHKATSGRLVAGPIRIVLVRPARATSPARTPPRPATAAAAAPAAAAPMSEADALARARADWVTYGPAYMAVFGNGQCTDWTAQRRPDIVEHATVRLWADHYMGLPDPGVSWNGGFWDDMARAARMPVGATPEAGAIVAFDPGTMQASPITGHVAYVESVDDDAGTFTISEMNAPVAWMVSYRTIRTSAIADGGITFVY
jgi:CHAP domain-containing protein